jgi:hypothetical protein
MNPLDLVRDLGRRYPTAWKVLEAMRSSKGRNGLPDWPSWCWCPLAAANAIATLSSDDRFSGRNVVDEIGAIASWRASQGIYKIHPDLIEPLSSTPLEEVPAEWLYQLPEWCIWVDLGPGGFFAHLESNANTRRPELRFWVVSPGEDPYPVIVHLNQPTLSKSVDQVVDEARRKSLSSLGKDLIISADDLHNLKTVAAKFTSLVVYVIGAVQQHDIRDVKGLRSSPAKASATPNHPTTWEVGWKQGEAFRAAMRNASQGGEHASPRPHIRRAHWHHFWEGPRSGSRRLVVRWLPPTFVGTGEIIPTIHSIDT